MIELLEIGAKLANIATPVCIVLVAWRFDRKLAAVRLDFEQLKSALALCRQACELLRPTRKPAAFKPL